jgi:alpha-galactosidase
MDKGDRPMLGKLETGKSYAVDPDADYAGIPTGDMPGDKVMVKREHASKASVLLPALVGEMARVLREGGQSRLVVSVYGGSGVGKSETASLLAHFLRRMGIGTYLLSGDNYPRRIPAQNDAERLRIYRAGGLSRLLHEGLYTGAAADTLRRLWREERDADPAGIDVYPWLACYQRGAREALAGYLGTELEIDFAEISGILNRFRAGENTISIKRMGRATDELWYESVDFTDIGVLFVEWTHGGSAYLHGVDIPVYLHSTPEETLAHRRARGRDGQADSAFTSTVLAIEGEQLRGRAPWAKLILSKDGRILTLEEFTTTDVVS